MRKSEYDFYTDEQLTELLCQEDTHAFESVYKRYFPMIYNFSRKMLQNDSQAEDATQQIFVNLLEKMGKVQITSIKSYLFQSIRNVIIDLARNRKIKINYIAAFKEIYNKGEYSTETQVIENDLVRHIEKEIDNLPPKMRAIFEMSRKQYLSNKEIAEAEGISEQSVKNALYRAAMRIRSRLSSVLFLNLMWAILWINKNR
ncbi:sigma-70 family RNA polymerase sigma factor [Chitinophaga oryziterrae]|uniref:Sigma-70 family RNA polymerase sigma factor n=1 Tax=Chitinophaga oryziterrae TaxID=1031224 RepID=A0A6N8J6L0_9BACT|nr:sigma-70 family RNA polymerase sigma factor [Chitinophaga oryziterrae]MVT40248.1 sigma-70 family RNA polymerase sigma factor [Chitinophaga oryziterrae]